MLILSFDGRGLLLELFCVMHLIFLVFKAHLFAVNQESTFCNCPFTFSYNLLYESTLDHKFVSSANITAWPVFMQLGRSSTYVANGNEPSIEP